jgi:hypothetical protein
MVERFGRECGCEPHGRSFDYASQKREASLRMTSSWVGAIPLIRKFADEWGTLDLRL